MKKVKIYTQRELIFLPPKWVDIFDAIPSVKWQVICYRHLKSMSDDTLLGLCRAPGYIDETGEDGVFWHHPEEPNFHFQLDITYWFPIPDIMPILRPGQNE